MFNTSQKYLSTLRFNWLNRIILNSQTFRFCVLIKKVKTGLSVNFINLHSHIFHACLTSLVFPHTEHSRANHNGVSFARKHFLMDIWCAPQLDHNYTCRIDRSGSCRPRHHSKFQCTVCQWSDWQSLQCKKKITNN